MSIIEKYRTKTGKEFAKQVIESYMFKQKIDSVEDFFKKNPTVNDFDNNSKLLNIIRTHGYFIMTDQIYLEIIEQLREEEEKKKKLDTDSVQTTTANGHEIVTYTDNETGEKIIVDNTVSNRDIKDQMIDVQNEHEQFRKKDTNNTRNVMNYMQEKIKITPDVTASNDINMDSINNDEREIAIAVKAFENEIGHHVDIDFNKKIIYDNGMIYSIEKREDGYKVIAQGEEKTSDQEKKTSNQHVKKKIIPPNAA